ncbi:C39 family peptidase [Roseburia hominis]
MFATGILVVLCSGDWAEDKGESLRINADTVHGASQAGESADVYPGLNGEGEEYQLSEKELSLLFALEPYSDQLRSLYEKYPQVGRIIVNRTAYPDWVIEYLTGHEEAVDWVTAFPDYAKLSREELMNRALAPVNLEEYPAQEGIPLYYQWDQTWGYAAYGNGTVATDGCGPTCLAMVVSALAKDGSFTPGKLAEFSMEEGFYAEDAGTSWSLMDVGAEKLGVHAWQIQNWSQTSIKEELAAGHPIICSMGPGDFTDAGHFIVLTGLTEDGKIIVNDPNSRVNSMKRWDAQVLLDQMKAMWAYAKK